MFSGVGWSVGGRSVHQCSLKVRRHRNLAAQDALMEPFGIGRTGTFSHDLIPPPPSSNNPHSKQSNDGPTVACCLTLLGFFF